MRSAFDRCNVQLNKKPIAEQEGEKRKREGGVGGLGGGGNGGGGAKAGKWCGVGGGGESGNYAHPDCILRR